MKAALLAFDRSKSQKYATAIHEAGHAVIARVLDLASDGATIVSNEDEGEAGHSITHDPHKISWNWDEAYFSAAAEGRVPVIYRDLQMAFRGRIIAYMAGAEAEVECLGRAGFGDGDDREQIEMMAQADDAGISRDRWSSIEPRLRRQTRRLVRKHRACIETVADALIKHKSLTGPEIDRLFVENKGGAR